MEVRMFKHFKKFSKDEDGAVTVDWVVLTAAVVALAGSAIVSIQGGTTSVGTSVSSNLSGQSVEAGF
jgi:Flp pilus assembly pilin Flp